MSIFGVRTADRLRALREEATAAWRGLKLRPRASTVLAAFRAVTTQIITWIGDMGSRVIQHWHVLTRATWSRFATLLNLNIPVKITADRLLAMRTEATATWKGLKLQPGAGIVLAAFHIVMALSSIMWIGDIAGWVAQHWHALTRAIWSRFAALLNLNIPAEIKDTLTSVFIFLPLAVTALWSNFASSASNEASNSWAAWRTVPIKILLQKLCALGVGAGMIYVLSRNSLHYINEMWRESALVLPQWALLALLLIFAPIFFATGALILLTRSGQRMWQKRLNAAGRKTYAWLNAAGNYLAVVCLFIAVFRSPKFFVLIPNLILMYFVAWPSIARPKLILVIGSAVIAFLTLGYFADAVHRSITFLESVKS